MQQFGRAVDGAAERRSDCLVAEAHSEQRGLRRGARLDERNGRARTLGSAGPGGEEDAVELFGGLGGGGVGGEPVVVVTPDLRLHTELTQVLDQVENETVVVVDDQDL